MIDCRSGIVAFKRTQRTPIHQRFLAVPAQVRPEHRKICRLINFDREVEKPRAISPIAMQQNYARRSFGSENQPTARPGSVMIAPGFVLRFQDWSGDLGKCLRGDQVSLSRRSGNSVDEPGHHAADDKQDYESDWEKSVKEPPDGSAPGCRRHRES